MNTKKPDLEMLQTLSSFNNIKLKLTEASGEAVAVEVLMRLIAERHESVQDVLKLVIKAEKRKPRNADYWDCDLHFLDKAIAKFFSSKLKPFEIEKIETFRPLRNFLLHGRFVDLMHGLGITPKGRIINPLGGKNILVKENISEAIKIMDQKCAFEGVRRLAAEVRSILEELVKYES